MDASVILCFKYTSDIYEINVNKIYFIQISVQNGGGAKVFSQSSHKIN